MDLYLVRHGRSVGNRDLRVQTHTTELSPEGLRQAELTGRWLARYFAGRRLAVAALYSSDMRRAWHTAEILGRHLGLTPIPAPGLREKDPGLAANLTWAEVVERYPDVAAAGSDFTDLDWGWPGGETRRRMRERVVQTLAVITARHGPGEQVVAVTHGGPIWGYLSGAVAGSPALTDGDPVNCGVTHIHFPLEGATLGAACLLAFNQQEHLGELEL
jgi:broad specificity phosphatase PhoE